MPHPIMFDDDDPGLAELRKLALGYPEAFEKVSHGRPGFFVSKMFAMYGGSTRESGQMVAVPHCVMVKVDEAERTALQQDQRFFYPAYLGPSGWLGLDFSVATVDWTEVGELVDASYRLVAGRKLTKLLDEA
ncbi:MULTISPECIES: MmcQ/YjbR family DNA-binding protein [unclassified Mycobacterium]|uniref:MmcQ/YjbR family DNA-binding protein n=1 Tax=unclassified Mycobacterium TaxID=2642494 RepID=UPI0029C72A87|nr:MULTISPECIES: MmcQ/YjbR family DNA-binding protein [unclassified Mycobacterium]